MDRFITSSLILVPLIVIVMAVVLRKLYRGNVSGYIANLSFFAIFTIFLTAVYTPYQIVAKQPAGKVVSVQLGAGLVPRVLIETDSAFYTVRGGFSVKQEEELELRTEQHPVFKSERRYLCSASGCAEILS